MTEIAILGPTSLLGKELNDELERRPHLWDRISLVASEDEEAGTVTEAAGAAALVSAPEPSALASADLIFACGAIDHDLPLVRQRLEEGEPGATAILLSAGATVEHGEPVISGVNPDTVTGGGVLVSPDPVAIALAHLLAPLARSSGGNGGPATSAVEAAATVVLPVSSYGSQGLDDLFDQTRDMLAMSGERRPTRFGRQLAFNLYPAPADSVAGIAGLVRRAAGIELPLAVEALQGAIFHGVSVNLFVRFGEGGDPGEEAVRRALAAQRHVTVSPGDTAASEIPAPIDAAASDEILVGGVRPSPEIPGGYWIWAVMDNLTRGGALNAVEVAELLQKIV